MLTNSLAPSKCDSHKKIDKFTKMFENYKNCSKIAKIVVNLQYS